MKLYIGNKNYSSWSMRPWVLLRQFGIPFDEVMLWFDDMAEGSPFKRAIGAITPTGRVPTLVDDDGLVVWDTLAIAEYLAERHPERSLWPRAPQARARARSVCAEMHSGFGALRNAFPMNIELHMPELGPRLLAEQPAVAADLARITQLWQSALDSSGGPFLFGAFSIADAYYAPVVARLRSYGLGMPNSLQAYMDRVWASPGVAAWVAEALAEKTFVPIDEPYRSQR